MRERFLDPAPVYDSFMPEWRNCTSKRSERIEIFHSEGLKTRWSFCIWWKDFYDPTKIEYFFDNRVVFFYPVVQRGWEDFSKRFPIRAKKRLPPCPNKMRETMFLDNWMTVRTGIWPRDDMSAVTLRWDSGAGIQKRRSDKAAIIFWILRPHFFKSDGSDRCDN